jgi:hypothetical protein
MKTGKCVSAINGACERLDSPRILSVLMPGSPRSFSLDSAFIEGFRKPTMPPVNLKKDDPQQIAKYLLDKHGSDGAYDAAELGALEAHAEGNNYRLSVWREVKQLLAQAHEEKS